MSWLSDIGGSIWEETKRVVGQVGEETGRIIDQSVEESLRPFEQAKEALMPSMEGGVGGILAKSAAEGIEAQEKQRERIRELYEPYYQGAITGGLPQLQALAEGGEIDYTPSRLYEYSKERGERNIRRTQASKGQLESSATKERMSDLNLGLAEEEMERLYSGQLSRVQIGAGAADVVGQANTALGGNVASLYSGLGAGLNVAQQQSGQARQSAYQGLSSSLMGLSKYMEAG